VDFRAGSGGLRRMSVPFTLFRYIGRQFLMWFSGVFLLVSLLIYIGNFVELTRRAAIRESVSLGTLSKMAGLQLPQTAEEVLPFAVLLGALLALWRMTRSQELIVARAAGISVWQFLTPSIVIAFLIGTFGVTVFNPVASKMQAAYQKLEAHLLRGQTDEFALASSGLWLRQSSPDGTQAVVHALSLTRPGTHLTGVSIFFFRGTDHLVRRLDAATADLEDGIWQVRDAYEWRVERDQIEHFGELTVPTNLTSQKIEESFAAPETMSFWALPGFISLLEKSGFPAHRHRLYFDSLLARPFLLCAMVLIAATFSLRMQRRGGTAIMLVGGIATGFMLWFLSEVVGALGSSGAIPIELAAWSPAGISTLLGATFLLHLEDG
jgi:lipopolysaccharide export system permease protein